MKNNKAIVFLAEPDFYDIGDKISIKDENGMIVGSASFLKIKKDKGIIKFNGKAETGYEIVQKYSQEETQPQPQKSFSSVSYNIREHGSYNNVKTIPTAQYVTGGILGTLLRFGIGHAVQGRYREKGWLFTTGELLSLLALVGSCDYNSWIRRSCDQPIAGLSAIAFIVFNVWEMIDVWFLPQSYKVVSRPSKEHDFFVESHLSPVLKNTPKLQFAFRFK